MRAGRRRTRGIAMLEWMLMPYRRYFDFSGRSRRKEYWMFFLFVMIVYVVFMVLATMFAPSVDPNTGEVSGGGMSGIVGILMMLFWAATIIPSIAVAVRRAHDQDKSGWFILIPIYSLIMMFLEGTRGPNRFGPDPKDPAGVEAFS